MYMREREREREKEMERARERECAREHTHHTCERPPSTTMLATP
jgi:hypothetical protein